MESKVNKLPPSREVELNDASELLMFAYRSFTAKPDKILAERGLQRVHHRILYFVGRHPGVSVNGLFSVLGVSKQALNAPLRQLVALELVESQVSESDKRIRELRLTNKGIQLESLLSGGQRERLDTIFRELGPAAESSWREVMKKLADGS